MKILVTGGAGFIGSALARRLQNDGHEVVVIDNFNAYYDVQLKRDRVAALIPDVPIYSVDITNREALNALFSHHSFDVVCHLAAQAGVRYSVEFPEVYIESNVLGTQVLYEVMKSKEVSQMVFASTSSVYGTSTTAPFIETVSADEPVSVYAATKRSGELLAHNYFAQYGIQTTCLRFFTVYGPWSRPDMAMLKFAQNIMSNKPIDIFNHGNLRRDFTYIDDIVDGFSKAVEAPLGYHVINLGNGAPVTLMDFVRSLEKELGKKALIHLKPMQQGDVYETYADITRAKELLGFTPQTNFDDGICHFVKWFLHYYKESK